MVGVVASETGVVDIVGVVAVGVVAIGDVAADEAAGLPNFNSRKNPCMSAGESVTLTKAGSLLLPFLSLRRAARIGLKVSVQSVWSWHQLYRYVLDLEFCAFLEFC